uniref:IPIL1 protein n=1 Tax=Cyanoderma ruficeps TaxID=181631 RepID=A0A8C3P1J8_9PASS
GPVLHAQVCVLIQLIINHPCILEDGFHQRDQEHGLQEDREKGLTALTLDSESEESEEENPTEMDMICILSRRFLLSVPKLASGRRAVQELLSDLLQVSHNLFSDSFLPVLEPAIGVGSASEGWSPHKEEDVVYCMFVPLKPPRGYAFHLEPDTMAEIPQLSMRVRVELVCTCAGEPPDQKIPCFLHNSGEELKSNQVASLLHTLCTGPYLDGEKIALWFQTFVISAWSVLPQSRQYSMKVVPSCRSCKMKLMKASGRSLYVEMVFSVQQGDSDIFLSSQPREAQFPPSTTWLESCAVAEAKFFRHVSMQAPAHSCHLKCLRLCARLLEGSGLSIYALKTTVMHLLTLIPLSEWQHRYLMMRVGDIMGYLRCCLEEKCLKHFFFGNEGMPEEISLPPAFQEAQPLNLFQHLVQDPAAQTKALQDYHRVGNYLVEDLRQGSGFSDSLPMAPSLFALLHWGNRNNWSPSTAVLTAKWHLMLLPSSLFCKCPF